MSIARKFYIIIHYLDNDSGPPTTIVNVDPNRYFDLVPSVDNMAPQQGDERHGLAFKMEYMVNLTGDKKKIIDDKDIMAMFEVSKRFSFIHVYATAVKLHEGGNP